MVSRAGELHRLRMQIHTDDGEKNADAVGDLQREERIHPPKDRQECEPGEVVRSLVPRGLVETVELSCDPGYRGHQQRSVQLSEECADHQRDRHEQQPTPCDLLATAGELSLQEQAHAFGAFPGTGSGSLSAWWRGSVMTVVGFHSLWPAGMKSFGMVGRASMLSTDYWTTCPLKKASII